MAPKKKNPVKAADAKDEPTGTEVKPTPAVDETKKEPVATDTEKPKPLERAKQPTPSKPATTATTTQPPKPAQVPKPTQSKSPIAQGKKEDKPSDTQPEPKRELSEAEKLQLRKFKFTATQQQLTLDEAAKVQPSITKLRDERLKKFGGNKPASTDELKKRAEKFGGNFVDKQELNQLKQKRKEKFGSSGKSTVLPSEQQAKLEERKKKFVKNAAEAALSCSKEDEEVMKKRAEKFNSSGAPEKKVKT